MLLFFAVLLASVASAAPAQAAAKVCTEPGARWQTATAAQEGMDAKKLQAAVDYGTTQLSFAVRVYRHGCLVQSDRLAALNQNSQFESWSMAKSVTSMIFGRAMALGLISPDDPVGSLFPEADAEHGKITMRDLLTQTSGLHWVGARDYDIAMPDRIRDALTTPISHPSGTWWEYGQSGPALLAEAVQRAVGEDFQAFAQRELFGPIGITAGSWKWTRDSKGHTGGFFGVQMRPDDYARLGDLLRRGGVWRGKRLLPKSYMRQALHPIATNGCYGWLIWNNGGQPCVHATITSRPVSAGPEFPGLPRDLWDFSGLFGQLVTVMPTQDIEVVRTGQDPGLLPLGSGGWEPELYRQILASVTDQKIALPPAPANEDQTHETADNDYGFQNALKEPVQVLQPWAEPPLPLPGPGRARALRIRLASTTASRSGAVTIRATCPAIQPALDGASCQGVATLAGARAARTYTIGPGATKLLRFTLRSAGQRRLRRIGAMTMTAQAINDDATSGGVPSSLDVTVRPSRR